MGVLDQWNRSVEKNWEYWEYYKDLYDFSLSKGASTFLTKHFYPFFYQERLAKREFVKNMQLLGELSDQEIQEYQKINNVTGLKYIYQYHYQPSGALPFVLFPPAFVASFLSTTLLYKSCKSISWYLMVPVLTFVTTHMLGINYYKLYITELIDCTHWALQKRRAEAWLEEKKHPTSKLAVLPELKRQLLEIVSKNQPK